MATRKVKLTGIAEWAKVFEANRDPNGYEGAYQVCDGACTIDVILDDANMAILKASRSIKRGAPDKDGRGMKVKFVRKFKENYGGGAPTVTHADGSVWDYDTDGTIGNGSTVEVDLIVYDTKMKNIVGTRLEAVTVLEHVKFIRPDDGDAIDMPSPASTSKATVDDAILF
tara:strand:- start:8018 stop:8527 length:510 start_codon:yes stop_codon:yes gene_type:complete